MRQVDGQKMNEEEVKDESVHRVEGGWQPGAAWS